MTDPQEKSAQPNPIVPPENAEAGFRSTYPLDFRLSNEDDQPALLIDEEKADQTLRLEISNRSPREIAINATKPDAETGARLELRFRPGALAAIALKEVQLDPQSQKDWDLGAPQENTDYVGLPLTSKKSFILRTGESRNLLLQNLSAAAAGGSRGSQVELNFQGLLYPGETEPLQGARRQHINIAALRGLQRIPLHVGFIGSGTVLNDGSTPNALGFRITNIQHEDALVLRPRGLDDPGRFILSFEVELEGESKEWALASKSQAEAVEVSVYGSQRDIDIDWDVRQDDEAERPTWYLTPPEGFSLAAGDHVRVNLTNLVTSLPDGAAYLSLRHENIPGFFDGNFVVEAMKGPLVVRGKNVGIGLPKLEEAFEVKGRIKLVSSDPANENKSGIILEGQDQALEVKGRIKDETGYVMPQGAIIMWSGGADHIPEGWVLCDGQNGTPDLQDRFIVGATPDTAGHSGGSTSHHHMVHGINVDTHQRLPMNPPINLATNALTAQNLKEISHILDQNNLEALVKSRLIGQHEHNVESYDTPSSQQLLDTDSPSTTPGVEEIRPRWYALCFIMKT